MKKQCTTPNCTRKAIYKEAEVCGACYQGLYYWKGSTPTRILRRQKQLDVLSSRMDMLTNVRTTRRRRAG